MFNIGKKYIFKNLGDDYKFSLRFIRKKDDYYIFEDVDLKIVELERVDDEFTSNGEYFEYIQPIEKTFKKIYE